MTSTTGARVVVLPALAAILVGGVLGVQIANGGGDFSTLRQADPCAVRAISTVSTGIDGLTERLVLLGLDRAACHLGVSREALALDLAQPAARTDQRIRALHAGLLEAVDLLKTQRELPPASDLLEEALDRANVNRFLKSAIRSLPDSAITRALKTDDVLRRTVDDLNLRTLLADLNNPDDLNGDMQVAVTKAVEQSLVARVRDLF